MKQYDVIVIDPPWPITKIKRNCRPNQKAIDYPLMDLEQIKQLPIEQISKDVSICFLWSIQKQLENSFEILKHWGFNYLLTLTWNKNDGLCLFGFHWQTEFILVGTKGKVPIYPKRSAMPSVFTSQSEGHSVKPQVFYDWAETFGSDRIDIFARKQRFGWDVFGNECYSSIELIKS